MGTWWKNLPTQWEKLEKKIQEITKNILVL